MKRDLELIRKMILAIEDSPKGFAPRLTLKGYTQEQIGYHAYLLIDAGYAKGKEVTHNESHSPEAIITRLNWKGHEFADAARDVSRWQKAMELIAEKAGTVTLEIVTQVLTRFMKAALDL